MQGSEVVRTIGFELGGVDQANAAFAGGVLSRSIVYTRRGNPTVRSCEARLAEIEGSKWSIATASGMAAIDIALSIMQSGHATGPWLFPDDVYSGTRAYALDVLQARRGVPLVLVPTHSHEQRTLTFIDAINLHRPSVVYLEPISNPLVSIINGPDVVKAAKAVGASVIVDNTFATPYLCTPLDWGSDIVVHSATKYLCGHNDTLAGVISGNNIDIYGKLLEYRSLVGASLGPDDAARLHSYMRTFELRVRQQNLAAITLAEFLNAHAAVSEVHFPGLDRRGGREAAAQMFQGKGFGAIVTFRIASGLDGSREFMGLIDGRIPHIGSLGDVETSLLHVESAFGETYPADLFRLSVGVDDPIKTIDILRYCLDKLRVNPIIPNTDPSSR